MAEQLKIYEDNYMFNRDEQADKLELAETENRFDKNFLKCIISVIDNMSEEDRIEEYKKFLKNPYTYLDDFDPEDWEEDEEE